jgi:bacterioferritin-associated ferredoxin
MYVCVCLAVSKSEVEDAIENGAETRVAVTRACGAGGDCGACHGMIETMIEDHQDAKACASHCPPVEASEPRLIPTEALVRNRAA